MFALLLALTATLGAQDTLAVLFAGNSYTYGHDMPRLFAELAESGGRHVVRDQSTPGGYTLEGHSTNPTTIGKIEEGRWDFVALQEQSQIPTIAWWRDSSMYPAARFLDSTITANNGQACFFMTWGREFGGQQTRGGHSSPVFVDYFHMQESLRTAYTRIANELGARLSPVGMGWARARTLRPDIDLWEADNSHPTLLGSYLAACVFYAELFQSTPVGLTYHAGLDSATAVFLQEAAEWTVLGIEENEPVRVEQRRVTTLIRAATLGGLEGRLFDVQGRDVTGGRRSLSPGIYYLRDASDVGRPATSKMIVTR